MVGSRFNCVNRPSHTLLWLFLFWEIENWEIVLRNFQIQKSSLSFNGRTWATQFWVQPASLPIRSGPNPNPTHGYIGGERKTLSPGFSAMGERPDAGAKKTMINATPAPPSPDVGVGWLIISSTPFEITRTKKTTSEMNPKREQLFTR